jgi:hypothetical protein
MNDKRACYLTTRHFSSQVPQFQYHQDLPFSDHTIQVPPHSITIWYILFAFLLTLLCIFLFKLFMSSPDILILTTDCQISQIQMLWLTLPYSEIPGLDKKEFLS